MTEYKQIQFEKTTKEENLLINGKKVDIVYCSPTKCAMRTAAKFGVNIKVIPGLAEIQTSNGMNLKDIQKWLEEQSEINEHMFILTSVSSNWWEKFINETEEQVNVRVQKTLRRLHNANVKIQNILDHRYTYAIVSHSNIINIALGLHTYPFKKASDVNPPNPFDVENKTQCPYNFKPMLVVNIQTGLDNTRQLVHPKNNISLANIVLLRHAHSLLYI